jgi:hypothetical protein
MIAFSWIVDKWTLVLIGTSTAIMSMSLYGVHDVELWMSTQGLHFPWSTSCMVNITKYFLDQDTKSYFWPKSTVNVSMSLYVVHDVECAMWDNDYILLNRREINFLDHFKNIESSLSDSNYVKHHYVLDKNFENVLCLKIESWQDNHTYAASSSGHSINIESSSDVSINATSTGHEIFGFWKWKWLFLKNWISISLSYKYVNINCTINAEISYEDHI